MEIHETDGYKGGDAAIALLNYLEEYDPPASSLWPKWMPKVLPSPRVYIDQGRESIEWKNRSAPDLAKHLRQKFNINAAAKEFANGIFLTIYIDPDHLDIKQVTADLDKALAELQSPKSTVEGERAIENKGLSGGKTSVNQR